MTRLELVDKLIALARIARTSDLDDAASLISHTACAIALKMEKQDLAMAAEAARRVREDIEATGTIPP